jgi:hypothetical protein
MIRFTKILKLLPTLSGLKQSEFWPFHSSEFATIFTEGRFI